MLTSCFDIFVFNFYTAIHLLIKKIFKEEGSAKIVIFFNFISKSIKMKQFVSGYDEFIEFVAKINKNQVVNFLFTGSKDEKVILIILKLKNKWYLYDFVSLGRILVSWLCWSWTCDWKGSWQIWKCWFNLRRSWRRKSVNCYCIMWWNHNQLSDDYSETWKALDNPFRKDKNTHLQVIPTLIRWGHPQRLEGDQLVKEELIQMFFSDED